MRAYRFEAGVLILLVAVAAASRIAALEIGRDDKASEVLAAARKEIGGSKLASLGSLSVQGTTERNLGNFQVTSDLELLVEMPDKYSRSETSNSAMVNLANSLGFNGDRPIKGGGPGGFAQGGGMIIRMGGPGGPIPGPAEPVTPEQQGQLDRQIVRSARHEITRLMLGWFGMAHPAVPVDYSYDGEAQSADGNAHVIDVKGADGFAARLFLDKKSHLPLMLTYQAAQPRVVTAGGPAGDRGAPSGGSSRPPNEEDRRRMGDDVSRQMQLAQKETPGLVEYTLFFDDWRTVDGIKFPHALRRAVAGTTTEEWTITKVKVNPRIDPKKFETAKTGAQ